MVKVDLITGFLGAGKTTFIHKYLHYLASCGEKVHLIENEFGETSIDCHLLAEEESDHCRISDLSGMCMCCIGKQAFIRMLIESAESGCDRIIVEPSGIYDVDEFFDVMSDDRVNALCEIGSIMTIVDPLGGDVLTEEAKYLLFAQLLASGTIIYSKTQLISSDQLEKAQDFIQSILVEKGCEGGLLAEVCTKSWDELSDSDFSDFQDFAYYRMVHDREEFLHEETFQSVEYEHVFDSEEDLKERVKAFFADTEHGTVFRVKGYARVKVANAGTWQEASELTRLYEVNCTGSFIQVNSIDTDKARAIQKPVLVIIGQKLKLSYFMRLK